MKRILLVGGGSGGHVYPVIAVANALKKKSAESGGVELMLLGDKFMRQAAQKSLPAQVGSIKSRSIISGKFRRYLSPMNLVDIFKFPVGLVQSLWHVFWFMPDVVFAKGSYVSVLPALVAKLYMIPLYIHESDSVPGLANRFLGRMASKIFTSFQTVTVHFDAEKTVLTGNPVRKNLLTGDRGEATSMFNFDPNKKTIFVYAGSRGAQKINKKILES